MRSSCYDDSVERGPAIISSSAAEHLSSGFLEGLTKSELHSILAAATLRIYPANSVVAHQGDPADYLFLLKTGCARLFYLTQQGQKVLLRWLLPGEMLGLAAILPNPSSYLVNTEILKKSSAFVWPRATIRRLVAQYPKLLDNALPFAADHLTWFLSAHLALVSRTARERLAQVLLSLADGIGRKVPGGVQLDITNEQLANAANITLFTASRFLSEWQRSGALEKGRATVTVFDPNRLFSYPI
ncbi:MAG TPA: Crp/Fnr family transcriptional regulator [Terriglobales bacterium]|nr:Crp/Fnr family transcriptional regulator [Terriglobales bacterium]